LFEIIVVPVVFLTFDVSVGGRFFELVLILLLANIGMSSVGTLFSAMVQLSRTRGALLSILVLVILLPMMIPATFALLWVFGVLGQEVTGSGALAMVGSFKASVGYMVVFDIIFTVTCWLLFGFVVQE
jgi:heme exporter protein B